MGFITGLRNKGGIIRAIRFNNYRIVQAYLGDKLIFDHYNYDLQIKSSMLMNSLSQLLVNSNQKNVLLKNNINFYTGSHLRIYHETETNFIYKNIINFQKHINICSRSPKKIITSKLFNLKQISFLDVIDLNLKQKIICNIKFKDIILSFPNNNFNYINTINFNNNTYFCLHDINNNYNKKFNIPINTIFYFLSMKKYDWKISKKIIIQSSSEILSKKSAILQENKKIKLLNNSNLINFLFYVENLTSFDKNIFIQKQNYLKIGNKDLTSFDKNIFIQKQNYLKIGNKNLTSSFNKNIFTQKQNHLGNTTAKTLNNKMQFNIYKRKIIPPSIEYLSLNNKEYFTINKIQANMYTEKIPISNNKIIKQNITSFAKNKLNIVDNKNDMSLNIPLKFNYFITFIGVPRSTNAVNTINQHFSAIFNTNVLILEQINNYIDLNSINYLNAKLAKRCAEKDKINFNYVQQITSFNDYLTSKLQINLQNNKINFCNDLIIDDLTSKSQINLQNNKINFCNDLIIDDLSYFDNQILNFYNYNKISLNNYLSFLQKNHINQKFNSKLFLDYGKNSISQKKNIQTQTDLKLSTNPLKLLGKINLINIQPKLNFSINDFKSGQINQLLCNLNSYINLSVISLDQLKLLVKNNIIIPGKVNNITINNSYKDLSFKTNEMLLINSNVKNIDIWLCPIQEGDTLYLRQGYNILQPEMNTLEVK